MSAADNPGSSDQDSVERVRNSVGSSRQEDAITTDAATRKYDSDSSASWEEAATEPAARAYESDSSASWEDTTTSDNDYSEVSLSLKQKSKMLWHKLKHGVSSGAAFSRAGHVNNRADQSL